MHEVLRRRLWRHIEALPEEQLYQALDFVEFLASKYARDKVRAPESGLQRFGERLEDKLRGGNLGLKAIRGTLDAVGVADRMFSGLADAGRSILREVEAGLKAEPKPEARDAPAGLLPPGERQRPAQAQAGADEDRPPPDEPLARI